MYAHVSMMFVRMYSRVSCMREPCIACMAACLHLWHVCAYIIILYACMNSNVGACMCGWQDMQKLSSAQVTMP